MKDSNYTIKIYPPKDKNQLWGARCEDLKLNASGETESDAFYNLMVNIPIYFKIKNEEQQHTALTKRKFERHTEQSFKIPAFA